MKVRLTARFFFDNNDVKKIDWIINEPAITHGSLSNPLKTLLKTVKEVQDEYHATFRKLHKEGEVFVIQNINGELSGIDFKKVAYWTLKVNDVTEYEPAKSPSSAD